MRLLVDKIYNFPNGLVIKNATMISVLVKLVQIQKYDCIYQKLIRTINESEMLQILILLKSEYCDGAILHFLKDVRYSLSLYSRNIPSKFRNIVLI